MYFSSFSILIKNSMQNPIKMGKIVENNQKMPLFKCVLICSRLTAHKKSGYYKQLAMHLHYTVAVILILL